MPENEQNLEGMVGNVDLSTPEASPSVDQVSEQTVPLEDGVLWWANSIDLSSVSLQGDIWENVQVDEIPSDDSDNFDASKLMEIDSEESSTVAPIDESVFLDSWETTRIKSRPVDDMENFWKYLRWFFFSSLVTVLWVLAIVLFFSFNTYITKASQVTLDFDSQQYVNKYKEKLDNVRNFFQKNNKLNYQAPIVWSENSLSQVNKIIDATDIDYIDKKDLLSNYVSNLVSKAQDNAVYLDSLKQDIAKQWFLPEELEIILQDEQAIDTIQRSLNALEVIKFSTATKVFSYMNTALATIAEMVRVSWSTVDSLSQLFVQLNSRWEKDIASYVYMCHLNPFETSANCDTIWDLDLYYNSIIKDKSVNIKLFKNSMNAISQLLEKEDTTLFSITFNGFNAQDENIVFNIEVYTSQDDEKTLMLQWKKNPNIFILTNIINLLKQSSFIIWAEINTKEINVETRTLSRWGISRTVNYSTMDFTVPVQKDTEREIFDYIDLDSIEKMIKDSKLTEEEKAENANNSTAK